MIPSGTTLLWLEIAAPIRLDLAIIQALKRRGGAQLSRNALKELFAQGQIRLEEAPARGSHLLESGRYPVQITWPESAAPNGEEVAQPSPEGAFLPIVFEDESLLVFDKRSGVTSLPHSARDVRSAVSAALAHFPGLARVGRQGKGGLEPGLLHRLDTGTSGLLAFAKTQTAFNRLSQAWRAGEVRKTYRAWVTHSDRAGVPQTLELNLGHDPDSAKRMVVLPPGQTRRIRGKPLRTVTHLRREHRVLDAAESGALHDIEIEIETGVLHQIRASLHSLGAPVVGDPIYKSLAAPRLWLHAWKLELPGASGTRLQLEAPLPEGWDEPLGA